MTHETIIAHTTNWIKTVVSGCNFCPFAAKAMADKTIAYTVLFNATEAKAMEAFSKELQKLDEEAGIETSFLIFPHAFENFEDYLNIVELAEQWLEEEDYEGIYQVASFHPMYCFAGSNENDAANYTNRSPYPMLHLLRESSVSKAVDSFPDINSIPDKNIAFARQKGLAYMQLLRAACMK